MINIKFMKLHKDAVIPQTANKNDAGLDLSSVVELEILPGDYKLIKTGLAIELPDNAEAQIRPRSGWAINNGITVLNTPGTIDSGYRGEIGVILINHGKEPFLVKKGMKIAQMIIKPIYEISIEITTELKDSERGDSGFGSSGE